MQRRLMSTDENLVEIGNTLNVSTKKIVSKPEKSQTKNELKNTLTGLVRPKEKDFRDHLLQ